LYKLHLNLSFFLQMNLRQFLQLLFGFLFLLNYYYHVLLFLLFFWIFFFFLFLIEGLRLWIIFRFFLYFFLFIFLFFNPTLSSSLSFYEILVGTFGNFGLIEVDSWILDYILHCDCFVHKFIFILVRIPYSIYGFDFEAASLVDCWVPNDFDLNYFIFSKYFCI